MPPVQRCIPRPTRSSQYRKHGPCPIKKGHLRRHLDFLNLVELRFSDWSRIGAFAKELGCSEKSLSRSTKAISRQTPHQVLTTRIILEAKRQLANSDSRVSTIGSDLGFSEATNFTKYFYREVGLTPLAFRRQCLSQIRTV
ncbi:helix-turn-helix domain-containing protein [Roseovarius rhodophyticola]|uniref:helix-turn-helix domain-containing protein n=1 Tax=Roseovarius rhodophyticola TaxID=3080827 RepID=UPI003BAF5B43